MHRKIEELLDEGEYVKSIKTYGYLSIIEEINIETTNDRLIKIKPFQFGGEVCLDVED